MRRLLMSGLLAVGLALAGCGGGGGGAEGSTTTAGPPTEETAATAGASGCAASRREAMTALSEFRLEMDAAKKTGKLTLDQLIAARDRLFNEI